MMMRELRREEWRVLELVTGEVDKFMVGQGSTGQRAHEGGTGGCQRQVPANSALVHRQRMRFP